MTYTIRYNRATNHLQGLAERTQARPDTASAVGYYAESACGVLTRNLSGLAKGASFEALTDAVAELERKQDRKPCKTCLKAAQLALQAEDEAVVAAASKAQADIEERGAWTESGETDLDLTGHGPHAPEVCRYSPTHLRMGIAAVTTIDCRPVGIVPACQQCADFYSRLQEGEEKKVAKINVAEILRVAMDGGELKILVHEPIRGDVLIKMEYADARWLFAQLKDMANAGDMGDWD